MTRREHVDTRTDWRDSFRYTVEMGSDAMIYIPSFIMISADINAGRGDSQTQTHRQYEYRIKFTLGKLAKTLLQTQNRMNTHTSVYFKMNKDTTDIFIYLYILAQGPDQLTRRLHERLMARKKIYLIAATFQDKYIIRFVVCSRVTESRDIAFAWEEIRSQANQVLNNNADHEEETPPHREHNGLSKDASVITKGIKLSTNGTSDDESEINSVTKKRRYMHEDICVGVVEKSLLPSNRNGVTLIRADAVVMGDDNIKEVSKKRKTEAIINALSIDHRQQIVNGSGGDVSDNYR
jgi:hypothetical protein